VQATVPIYRLRIVEQNADGNASLSIGSFLFSHPLPFDHDTRLDALTLASGERFVGKLETVGEGKDRIAIRPAFLPKDVPSISVDVKDLERIVPALVQAEPVKEEAGAEGDDTAAAQPGPRALPFIPHGILLQNGDRLMARLMKLDAETAVLELPGRVELKLPRAALRKVDLHPGMPLAPPPAEGAGAKEDEAQKTEKAGDDKKKEGEGDKGGKDAKDEPKPAPSGDPLDAAFVKQEKTGVEFVQRIATVPGKTNTAGMPRMDNAEILAVDLRSNSLTVDPKDGGPPWPIDLHSARFLVFPAAPAVGAGNAGGWDLTLRIGSRFAFELQSVGTDGVRGKLAGGEVTMPWSAIESLARIRPAGK